MTNIYDKGYKSFTVFEPTMCNGLNNGNLMFIVNKECKLFGMDDCGNFLTGMLNDDNGIQLRLQIPNYESFVYNGKIDLYSKIIKGGIWKQSLIMESIKPKNCFGIYNRVIDEDIPYIENVIPIYDEYINSKMVSSSLKKDKKK